jgi:dienelactone hydrolase
LLPIVFRLTELTAIIGPLPERTAPEPRELDRTDTGPYIRHRLSYQVETGDQGMAFLLVPKQVSFPAPAVVCHHQHTGQRIGKVEPAGLEGDPDLAHAHELALRGFITFAPDAPTFGERRDLGDPVGFAYWELATRLVTGRTLLAKALHDLLVGIDVLAARPEVDAKRIGFIGHSYGGRMALWAAACDDRIAATVSHCGCVPYAGMIARDAGIQMEFVVPGIIGKLDHRDLAAAIAPRALFLSGTSEDRWSRGLGELANDIRCRFPSSQFMDRIYAGGHRHTGEMRADAYVFLEQHLR